MLYKIFATLALWRVSLLGHALVLLIPGQQLFCELEKTTNFELYPQRCGLSTPTLISRGRIISLWESYSSNGPPLELLRESKIVSVVPRWWLGLQ